MNMSEINRENGRKGGEINRQRAIQARKEYESNPKLCLYCGKPLPYKEHKRKKFCSLSCAASYNNQSKRTQNHVENRYCKHCGTLIIKRPNETWQDYNRKQFCNNTCKWEHYRESYITQCKNGEVSGIVGDDLSEIIRQYLINKAGNKCSKCGWHEVNPHTNKIPLEIHHIDGNPYNNVESNLDVLCPNCHSLTNTFKKGKGRRKRRERYNKK